MRTGMWKQVLGYAALLALGACALAWLDVQLWARAHAAGVAAFLIAAGFLALGVYIGARVLAPAKPHPFDANPQAQASLGISPRELEVLNALAEGRSNKEIAQALGVSPNTVKTHVARLFEKLGARRRTEAIAKARDLGLTR